MFYDIYASLCKRKGISCSRAALDMGFSNSIVTKWKKQGVTPQGETLAKVAAYFGVSINELIDAKIPDDITFDSFTYALHNESKDLSPENKEKLIEMARFFKQQEEKEKNK